MVHREDFIGPQSFETLGKGSEPPHVINIRVSNKTLMGKNWMQEANWLLRLVHWILRAIRFRFPEDVVDNLLQQASGKLDREARQLALDLIDTSDLQYGYTADLGVDEVHSKKGVLQPVSYAAGVVDGDWWEALGMCTITPEWCLHVPHYTCPALFTSSEKHFLRGCSTPPPYISLLPPVSSH